MKQLIGKCPYCGPNYSDVPNFAESVKGYDLPLGNPYPGPGRYDPGIRGKIFSPMQTNDDGYREVSGGYITTNPMIKCDTKWRESIYHNFEQYVEGRTKAVMVHKGTTTSQVKVPITKPNTKVMVYVEVPPLYSRVLDTSSELKDLKEFLDQKNGTVASSEAICTTNKVDIAVNSPNKRFTSVFLDSVLALQKAADLGPLEQIKTFKQFVDDFGTHFAKTTWMGVKLYAERRYSAEESESHDDKTLMRCNSVNGQRFMAVNLNEDLAICEDNSLLSQGSNVDGLQNVVVSSYGTFASNSDVDDWADHVVEMQDRGRLIPRQQL